MTLKVLITGASGLIGSSVWDLLSQSPDRYELAGLDLEPDPEKGDGVAVGNVADFAQVAKENLFAIGADLDRRIIEQIHLLRNRICVNVEFFVLELGIQSFEIQGLKV